MPIRYRCPNCHKLLRAGSRSAGKKIACPACGDQHRVPEAAAPVEEVVSGEADDDSVGSAKSAAQVPDCESYFQMPAAPPSKSAQPSRVEPQEGETFEREVDDDQDDDDVGFTPKRRVHRSEELDLIPMVD